MIDSLKPMLLEKQERTAFDGPDWAWEFKYDGHRGLAQCGALGVQLRTRNMANSTRWYPEISQTLASVKGKGMVLDGEMCVLDELGRSDFNAMQARSQRRRWVPEQPVVFCVFDVLVNDCRLVIEKPLHARKKLLDRLRGLDRILVVDYFENFGTTVYEKGVLPLKLEGMVGKRLDSPYLPGRRTDDWVKVKRPGAVSAQRFKRDPL